MEYNDKTIRLARYCLVLIFPKYNSYIFLIYLYIKYVVKSNQTVKERRMHHFGLKCKIIPDDLHGKIVKKVTEDSPVYGPCHQIIVPVAFFKEMHSENLYYRDGNTLWACLEPKLDKESLIKLCKLSSDLANVKKYIAYEKDAFARKTIELLSNEQSRAKKIRNGLRNERIVQLIPFTSNKEGEAYLTEGEYFNIKQKCLNGYPKCKFGLKLVPIKLQKDAPKIAKRMIVQMINCASYLGTDIIDLMLNNYFKTPKFLHQDDYFGVPVREEYTGHLHLKYFKVLRNVRCIYFKCKLISQISKDTLENSNNNNLFSGVGYFVVKGETDLIQDENINSFIPKLRSFGLKDNNFFKSQEQYIEQYLINTCPFGLENLLTDLKSAVTPFILDKKVSVLHMELKCVLQPVFLFRGPSGSGRSLVARRLAEQLGMQFLATSSTYLAASTAKQAEAKIEALLQRAKSSAPVVVYLEQFDVFGLDAEKNEDARIVESFVKKLTDLYENFTKFPIIIIASCENSVELKPNLMRIFLEEFIINYPDKSERTKLLEWMSLAKNISFCDDNFKPLLNSEESLLYTNDDNIIISNENVVNKDVSLTKYIDTNDGNVGFEKKNKKSKTGRGKTSDKSKMKRSDRDRSSEELAVEMVSVEEKLIVQDGGKNKTLEDNIDAARKNDLVANENVQMSSISKTCETSVDSKDNARWQLNEKYHLILENIASKTETFIFGDLDALTNLSIKNGYLAQKNICNKEKLSMGFVRKVDFDEALETLRLLRSKKLGSLKIPNVQWEDIGGLEDLKKEISRTIELPLKFPHLLANSGLKRSGLLLWGPPGCGKTLVARAVASQLQASFLSIKGPELLDMYVGQSERNMREVFASARASAPCVIFLDEAEAAAGARGASGDAGGAADRLVSQLLAELDGVAARDKDSQSGPVIVVAATNRPDLVEPALLRPGRLDKLLYVGPYEGDSNKLRVLNAACRGFILMDKGDLKSVAEALPAKCTGADLAAVVNQARRIALRRAVNRAESGEVEPSQLKEEDIVILKEDFLKAVNDFVPSISESEMNYYESLKTKLS